MVDESKQSFWTTVPGVVTAVGDLIAAAASLIGAFAVLQGTDSGSGGNGDKPTTTSEITLSDWAQQSTTRCARFLVQYQNLDAASRQGEPDIAQAVEDLSELGRLVQTMHDDVTTVPRPGSHEAQIDSWLREMQNEASEYLIAADAARQINPQGTTQELKDQFNAAMDDVDETQAAKWS